MSNVTKWAWFAVALLSVFVICAGVSLVLLLQGAPADVVHWVAFGLGFVLSFRLWLWVLRP